MKKDRLERPLAFYERFDRRPEDPQSTHYCPGCGHGIMHKLIAEAIDDLGIGERTILVSPVGCAVFAYDYFRVGNIQAPHGRAPGVATAVKRARPDAIVISYQGDGDLAAIGGNDILHAANRGENFTVFFVNNALYGMTGGQMAPTTLAGQATSTTPGGRDYARDGNPIRVCELLNALEGPAYLERCSLDDTGHIAKTRTAVRRALQCQMDGHGFSLVEVLSMCPTGWKLDPVPSQDFIREKMMPTYPLGVVRPLDKTRFKAPSPRIPVPSQDGILEALGLEVPRNGGATRPVVLPKAREGDEHRIVVSGFGGQGVLFLGQLLAKAGLRSEHEVSWLPSYGPEMRGGTAHCHVVVGPRRVGSPVVSSPSILIALNQPSLDKFAASVAAGGLVLYDLGLATERYEREGVRCVGISFSAIANELGDADVANSVALGALLQLLSVVPADSALATLSTSGAQRLRALNARAFEAGVYAVKNAALAA